MPSTTRDTALQTLAFHYQMTEVDLLKRNLVSFDEHGLVDVREVPAKRAERLRVRKLYNLMLADWKLQCRSQLIFSTPKAACRNPQ